MRNRILRYSVVALLVCALPVAGWAAAYPRTARAHFIALSDFNRVGSDLYAHPSMSDEELRSVQLRILDAQRRVEELFGAYTARPVVIVAADEASARRYSGNQYASMTLSPFGGSYVVLGPEGLISIDVIAHELAHAEHFARVGYLRWVRTPAWFVEGLGMQVDHRPAYHESVLSELVAEHVPDARVLSTFSRFSQGDLTANYAVSKREVARVIASLDLSELPQVLAEQPLLGSFVEHLEARSLQSQ